MIDIPVVALAEQAPPGIIVEYAEEGIPDIFIVTIDPLSLDALARWPLLPEPAPTILDWPPY